MPDTATDHDGLISSAVLMMILDEDTAAEVFKHLTSDDAHKLSVCMASLSHLSSSRVSTVLSRFNSELDEYAVFNLDSKDHIRSILVKALGEDRANTIIEDIFEPNRGSGIDALNLMDANVVAELIRDEHPQIIATIVVHLERSQASDVISHFDDELRNEIVMRVARFSGVQPAALKELTESMTILLDGQNLKRSKMGGVSTAAEILNLLNSAQEESVITSLRIQDDKLAQQIIDEMFVFEDLLTADDRTIQRIIRELNTDQMAVALKGVKPELADRFVGNMANSAAELLRDEMEVRGPLRLSQVEAQQKEILELIRRLADEGEITLGSDDDQYV